MEKYVKIPSGEIYKISYDGTKIEVNKEKSVPTGAAVKSFDLIGCGYKKTNWFPGISFFINDSIFQLLLNTLSITYCVKIICTPTV